MCLFKMSKDVLLSSEPDECVLRQEIPGFTVSVTSALHGHRFLHSQCVYLYILGLYCVSCYAYKYVPLSSMFYLQCSIMKSVDCKGLVEEIQSIYVGSQNEFSGNSS